MVEIVPRQRRRNKGWPFSFSQYSSRRKEKKNIIGRCKMVDWKYFLVQRYQVGEKIKKSRYFNTCCKIHESISIFNWIQWITLILSFWVTIFEGVVKFLFFFTVHAKMIQIIFLIFNRFNARKYLFACTRTIIFIGHWRNRTKRSCSSFHRITTDRRGSICRQRKRVLVLYLSRFMAFFPFPFF